MVHHPGRSHLEAKVADGRVPLRGIGVEIAGAQYPLRNRMDEAEEGTAVGGIGQAIVIRVGRCFADRLDSPVAIRERCVAFALEQEVVVVIAQIEVVGEMGGGAVYGEGGHGRLDGTV